MKKLVQYLHLNEIGLLEMLFAFYYILSGYSWGVIKGNVFFALLMAIIAFAKKKKNRFAMRELLWVIVFVFIHELILFFGISGPQYMINNVLSSVLICISVFPIVRAIDYKKMVGSLNWVAILSIGGIAYHFFILTNGGVVRPIPLPFLSDFADDSTRLLEEGFRPTSFYWEPAAFVTFMMVPLAISLFENRFIWSGIIMFSMFLSTSTTGITMSILMLMVYILSQKVKIGYKIGVSLIGGLLIYALFFSLLFSEGLDKIYSTDFETTSRIANGLNIVKSVNPSDLVFGIPSPNLYDYYNSGGINSSDIIIKDNSIFCSTFWLVLAKYGIFGLLLFLMIYLRCMRESRYALPYIAVLLVAMFFQSLPIGSSGFAYQLVFLYSFIRLFNNKSRLA